VVSAAGVSGVGGTGQKVTLNEGWTAGTAAGIGHASYAITGWGTSGVTPNLNALTGVRALSTTVALSLSPGVEGADVGWRGVIRVSARYPAELEAADGRLQAVSTPLGVSLTALLGQQVAGLVATKQPGDLLRNEWPQLAVMAAILLIIGAATGTNVAFSKIQLHAANAEFNGVTVTSRRGQRIAFERAVDFERKHEAARASGDMRQVIADGDGQTRRVDDRRQVCAKHGAPPVSPGLHAHRSL